jgi:hypothetical protein
MSVFGDKTSAFFAPSDMDSTRSRYAPSNWFIVCAIMTLPCVACGFGGRLDLGDNGGTAGVAGLSEASGGSAPGGASSAGFGGVNVAGGSVGAGGATTGAGGSSGGEGPLRMDVTGVVPLSSNGFGIHGRWYAYSDELDGGQTRLAGYYEGVVPFVAGRGMCIDGTTQSGFSDNFTTWGAGIGIALNVVDGSPQPLVNPPACFTIVISADAQYPSDLRADLFGDPDAEGQPVNVPMYRGVNEVCWPEASVFAYCTPELKCQMPDSLNVGLSKINVTAPSGSVAGPISFCIESITPHN